MIILNLMSYLLQVLHNVTHEDNDAICQLSKKEFKNVCEEVLKSPHFEEFSLKSEDASEDCKIRFMIGDSNSESESQENEELRVRLCPTSPKLYLEDGKQRYSANAYQFIGGRFVRIRRFKHLTTLNSGADKAEEEEGRDGKEKRVEKEEDGDEEDDGEENT